MTGDGGDVDRDTLPGAWALECEHCGCEAVIGDAPIGEELNCITCSHPGRVALDATQQPAWILRDGRCLDSKCGNCNPSAHLSIRAAADEAQAQFHLIDEQRFASPDAGMLVKLARNLADSLGIPAELALTCVVDNLRDDLAQAQRTLGTVADLARRTLTAHVVRHGALQ
jgi:hypothetical protein